MGGSTTTTSSNAPTGWMAQAGTTLNQAGQNILNTPYTPYTGQGVAPTTGNQQSAYTLAQNNSYAPYIGAANTSYGNANTNWNANTASQYMSPYIGAALDPVAQKMATDFAVQNRSAADASVANGAFGGTRQQLLNSYNQGQQQQAIGNMYAQGYQQAYNQAANQFNADRGNQIMLGNAYTGLGTTASNLQNSQIGALSATGATQQQTNQAQNTFDYNQFMRQLQYPYQQAGEYNSLISNLPYSSTGTMTQPGGSVTGQLTGLLSTGLGAYMGAGGTFSDRRLKTDIKRVGKLDNGLPVYRYRYKGDHRTHIGVMAQDVEKKGFGAVIEHPSGYKQVDYRRATAPTFGALKEAA